MERGCGVGAVGDPPSSIIPHHSSASGGNRRRRQARGRAAAPASGWAEAARQARARRGAGPNCACVAGKARASLEPEVPREATRAFCTYRTGRPGPSRGNPQALRFTSSEQDAPPGGCGYCCLFLRLSDKSSFGR